MTEPTLDDHLDALGAGLEQGRVRSERRRRRVTAGAGVALATVAVGLGALVAVPGGHQLDPVAEARAALEAEGGLLHYVLIYQSLPPEGSKIPPPDPDAPGTAVWTATTGPDRYRMKTPADGGPMYCGTLTTMNQRPARRKLSRRITGVSLVSPTEHAAAADGVATTYSPFSKAIVVVDPPARPDPTLPTTPRGAGFLLGALPSAGDQRDPVRLIRDSLAKGQLRDDGIVTVDGRRLRRLVGELPPTTKGETRPTQLTYLVDADRFVPVQLRSRRWAVWSRAGGRDHHKLITDIVRFRDFTRLADTPENAALLEIATPAGTTELRIDGRGRITPEPLPKRFSPVGGADRAARKRCEAAMRTTRSR